MFTKDEKGGFKEAETIIGPSVKVKGEFNASGNVVIEGALDGNLKTGGSLYVGDKAKVTANVEAQEARIGGELTGNIKVQGHLDIANMAVINGDIACVSLAVAKGAIINGKCSMTKDGKQAKEKITE